MIPRYESALQKVSSFETLEDNYDSALESMATSGDIKKMLSLLKQDLAEIAGDNFNYVQVYFERLLPSFTQNNDLWTLYLGYVEGLCK